MSLRFEHKALAFIPAPGLFNLKRTAQQDLVRCAGRADFEIRHDFQAVSARNAGVRVCRERVLPAARHTTSEICSSCRASGLDLRQTMPMVREGCGFLKRTTDTEAERVSTATAISGIKVTPMPAPTIWTRVDSELASSTSRGGACMLQ